jgi:hypothetical protein
MPHPPIKVLCIYVCISVESGVHLRTENSFTPTEIPLSMEAFQNNVWVYVVFIMDYAIMLI